MRVWSVLICRQNPFYTNQSSPQGSQKIYIDSDPPTHTDLDIRGAASYHATTACRFRVSRGSIRLLSGGCASLHFAACGGTHEPCVFPNLEASRT